MCLIMYKYILQIPKKDRINQQIHFHCVNFILDWWKTSHGIRILSLIQETYPFTLSNSSSFLSQYISFHCFYNFSSLFIFSINKLFITVTCINHTYGYILSSTWTQTCNNNHHHCAFHLFLLHAIFHIR
jgi:hypothetical protein